MNQFMTVQQAATELNISEWKVRKEIHQGRLRAYRIGTKLLRIDRADFDKWKSSQNVEAQPEGAW